MGAFDDDPTDATRPKGLLGNGLPTVLQEATVVVKAPVGTTLESIPAPRPPAAEGELTPEEEKTFEACKAGMDNLHKAFWIAGKSLETMATGNLHRNSGHPNFADFVWVHWEISESQTYRLMDEWRIGEALSQMGWHPRESQVRKLVDIKNAAGNTAAVAVYDAVARTGKRVTASLLEDVARRLPPLTPDSSPVEIGQMVRGILAPPPPAPEPATDNEPAGDTGGAQSDPAVVNGTEGPVHNITTIGGNPDSPIGESGAQASDSKGSAVKSVDLERLNETLALLREAERGISKPAVRRALEAEPAAAAALLAEIESSLNKIGRTVAVRRPE
ncbi:hypothetical protein [Streptomyces roseochromogenus]|uniref:Uncharacterized protein n=1 Tax=Streptomyces roseochromogenus subsp. oscitans DS 12.976 TaxID=1352936 RepID=V6JFR7_STRRC|nr:hypothetical protein [Streptomyces roseochromogenus]EST18021.1 hypothetical protein M878_45980 [Streptomyces roseochromogenus subsp. oscitans DS 12.976]